jgi:hypothetical protein
MSSRDIQGVYLRRPRCMRAAARGPLIAARHGIGDPTNLPIGSKFCARGGEVCRRDQHAGSCLFAI